jgi:ADP-ribosylglycohydrolase
MKNIWLDTIMGVATGDALGLPVQFKSRKELLRKPVTGMAGDDDYMISKGVWSDDTSMTLAILDSLIKRQGVEPKDIMDRFVAWLFDAEYCSVGRAIDIGMTCGTSIEKYRRTGDIKTAGKTGERANGNGSLMRTMPLSLYYSLRVMNGECTIDEAIKGIHEVSALTHNHPRACIACGLDFFCFKAMLSGKGSLNELLQKGLYDGFTYYTSKEEYVDNLLYYKRTLDIENFKNTHVDEIASSGYVVDTFEAAVWCLITTDNYKDAMLKAVNLGDDTDTVAAVAGGIAGLYYGYEAIPEEWKAELMRRDYLEEMCEKAQVLGSIA